ncbi:MAG: outer membrane lipoprotein-sorting protein [Verrucomicrobia bacterium]|nr:outer membrane lipoprotein-sorting protein [Verrucomicrobiota bacterium]MBT4276569.1 outer membrane lipoprotein-sorting protein [Verrucomicrobiota bacterium]MBT5060869.1 outer membrane lipoprotein-sorting protein [Verrucomicrobiota bacterium]MBT5479974.1 outer membrane lipoprotein-sorting protein [Verrucomicrobiota bacterium]MBT6239597.1 outer membrane lipoprotein-sorting protein [Verrucomicrobiota bacterium]
MKNWSLVLLGLLFAGFLACLTSLCADPIREGQALAKELRLVQLGIPGPITATFKIRKRDGTRIEHYVQKHTEQFENGWRDLFQISKDSNAESEWLWINHSAGASPSYKLAVSRQLPTAPDDFQNLNSEQAMASIGESDFWIVDLGLDFLHWPDQRIFQSKIKRRKGVACKLLESSRPTRSLSGYYKVRSWISIENGGIVYAEAFDINDRKMKVFEVAGVEKIEGVWYLKGLRIRNLRDKSMSVLEFDNKSIKTAP